MKRNKDLAVRFLVGEGQSLKDRPEPKKRKWLKTLCPRCGYKIEYSPKPGFSGKLRCGSCGTDFQLTMLDHFSINHEKEEKGVE